VNRFERTPGRRKIGGSVTVLVTIFALAASAPVVSQTTASDGPGAAAAWTTGNKLAVGTSADTNSKVWFTVAKGITTEVFYPRLDLPNMQDMQYIITDGSTFADLERDATNHAVSMPDEKALEYTITNTDKRTPPRYSITNTYITDPSRDTLLIRTRFQSLDGKTYQLYLLENPSMGGGGSQNNASWDATNSALITSGTELLGSSAMVFSALKAAPPNTFAAHDNGFSGQASDCFVDLTAHQALSHQFDNAGNGNVVQCGEIGAVGTDTTFIIALGYGSDAASAVAAANGSLTAGFTDREAAYRGIPPSSGGWEGYVNGLTAAPASVSSDTARRRAYYVAAMALHASPPRGVTSPMGTHSTTATTGFGVATCTSRRRACLPQETPRRRSAWRSFCGMSSTSAPAPPETTRPTRPARSRATARSAGSAVQRRSCSAVASSSIRMPSRSCSPG
jgi:glucoamylase